MATRLKIELIVGGALLILVISLGVMWKHERKERIRTEGNQNALLKDNVRFKTADSLNVLQNERLTLTNRELRKSNLGLADEAKNLGVKVRRLENAQTTATQTTTDVQGVVRDSIIYRDKERLIKDTLRCIDFSDGWVTAEGCVDNGVFNGVIVSKDTLINLAERIPRFLWFGTKAIRQTIYSKNPHTVIQYNQVVQLKRR